MAVTWWKSESIVSEKPLDDENLIAKLAMTIEYYQEKPVDAKVSTQKVVLDFSTIKDKRHPGNCFSGAKSKFGIPH